MDEVLGIQFEDFEIRTESKVGSARIWFSPTIPGWVACMTAIEGVRMTRSVPVLTSIRPRPVFEPGDVLVSWSGLVGLAARKVYSDNPEALAREFWEDVIKNADEDVSVPHMPPGTLLDFQRTDPLENDEIKKLWIMTYSGQIVRPLDPDPESIVIEDIAHALSNQCRFTGQVHTMHSVAHHSVLVSQDVRRGLRLQALMHDAAEAYLVDLAHPLKPALPDYARIEDRLLRVIYGRFSVPWPTEAEWAEIHQADVDVLADEAASLFGKPDNVLLQAVVADRGPCRVRKRIAPVSSAQAKRMFLDAFDALQWGDMSQTEMQLGDVEKSSTRYGP